MIFKSEFSPVALVPLTHLPLIFLPEICIISETY